MNKRIGWEDEVASRAINAEPWEPMPGMAKRQCSWCRYFFAAPWTAMTMMEGLFMRTQATIPFAFTGECKPICRLLRRLLPGPRESSCDRSKGINMREQFSRPKMKPSKTTGAATRSHLNSGSFVNSAAQTSTRACG